jgi:hypothetical protein
MHKWCRGGRNHYSRTVRLQSHSTSQRGHGISVLRANESESPLEQESADPAIIHAVDTAAASEERSKFRRSLGRWDTTFLMLAAIIVLDTLGAVSSYGAQAFTWLIVMVVFFLVPYGLITAELGTDVPRPYLIPGGKVGLWTAGILTTAWCALTTIAIIYPGIGTAHPDDSLPSGFEHQRLEYTLSQVIPLVVMILIGLLFYALGAPTRRQARADAASSEAVPDEAPSSEASPSETTSSETTSSDTTSG